MKSAFKSSRLGRSGPKSVGGSRSKIGNKDLSKQFLVERKDAERRLKKAIEATEKKTDKKLQKIQVIFDSNSGRLDRKIDD